MSPGFSVREKTPVLLGSAASAPDRIAAVAATIGRTKMLVRADGMSHPGRLTVAGTIAAVLYPKLTEEFLMLVAVPSR